VSELLELSGYGVEESVIRVKELLEQGSDPNEQDEFGETPLHRTVISCNEATVEIARALIAAGANVNQRDKYGKTPFYEIAIHHRPGHPCFEWHILMAMIFVENGKADLNVYSEAYDGTALHLLAGVDADDMIRLLLIYGADRTLKDSKGRTPLDVAIAGNHTKSAGILRNAAS